jgi:hypothetical protein
MSFFKKPPAHSDCACAPEYAPNHAQPVQGHASCFDEYDAAVADTICTIAKESRAGDAALMEAIALQERQIMRLAKDQETLHVELHEHKRNAVTIDQVKDAVQTAIDSYDAHICAKAKTLKERVLKCAGITNSHQR